MRRTSIEQSRLSEAAHLASLIDVCQDFGHFSKFQIPFYTAEHISSKWAPQMQSSIELLHPSDALHPASLIHVCMCDPCLAGSTLENFPKFQIPFYTAAMREHMADITFGAAFHGSNAGTQSGHSL